MVKKMFFVKLLQTNSKFKQCNGNYVNFSISVFIL